MGFSVAKDLINKIATSTASGGGDFLKDGIYELLITKIKIAEKAKKEAFKGDMFVVEFFILAAEQDAANPDLKPSKQYSTASFVVNLTNNLSAPGNVKGFVINLLGVEDADAEEIGKTLEALIGETQPGRGMRLRDETYRKGIVSKPGQTMTAHRWIHIEQTSDEVAEWRKKIDEGKLPKAA